MRKETIRILEWIIDINRDGTCTILKYTKGNNLMPICYETVKTLKEALEYVAERIDQ